MKKFISALSAVALAAACFSFVGCSKTPEERCADGDFSACMEVGSKALKSFGSSLKSVDTDKALRKAERALKNIDTDKAFRDAERALKSVDTDRAMRDAQRALNSIRF